MGRRWQGGCVIAIVSALALPVWAEAYKDGKVVAATDCQLEVGLMRWGLSVVGEDRLVGEAKRYGVTKEEELAATITLTFDVFDRQGKKIDSLDLGFNMTQYGYVQRRNYFEGPFCVDFERISDAGRISLANIKIGGQPVVYRTYNITKDLMRTGFKLPEPKAIPIKTKGNPLVKQGQP